MASLRATYWTRYICSHGPGFSDGAWGISSVSIMLPKADLLSFILIGAKATPQGLRHGINKINQPQPEACRASWAGRAYQADALSFLRPSGRGPIVTWPIS